MTQYGWNLLLPKIWIKHRVIFCNILQNLNGLKTTAGLISQYLSIVVVVQ